jgi:hypothetical protein
MALDLLDAPAPMTEAQVARLARRGEWPANESHAPARPPRTDALDVRLEVLEAAAWGRRGLSPAMAGELVTLRGAQAAAARARRRERTHRPDEQMIAAADRTLTAFADLRIGFSDHANLAYCVIAKLL